MRSAVWERFEPGAEKHFGEGVDFGSHDTPPCLPAMAAPHGAPSRMSTPVGGGLASILCVGMMDRARWAQRPCSWVLRNSRASRPLLEKMWSSLPAEPERKIAEPFTWVSCW